MDPIHQFQIKSLFPIAHIGNTEIAFTNSALFMLIAVALISFLMLGTTRSRALVPGRLQSLAEMSYEFVASNVFILVVNVVGIIPYAFTVTSHIIITVALALLVFFTVIIYGFWKNGLGFLKLFVPSGIPIYILPLVTFIEVMSFHSRPVSHSVRLFANMLAGHITLKVFGGFVVMLSAFGVLGWLGALLPLGLTIALTALELLVAALQAYVFAILTCIYLNDAIHPGH
jgi:F-type H+-transporting ATPase subunit a